MSMKCVKYKIPLNRKTNVLSPTDQLSKVDQNEFIFHDNY